MHIKRHSNIFTTRIRVLQRQKLMKAGSSITLGKTIDHFSRTWLPHHICATWNRAIIQKVLLTFSYNRSVRFYLGRYLRGSLSKYVGIGGSIDIKEYLRHWWNLDGLRIDCAITILKVDGSVGSHTRIEVCQHKVFMEIE